MTLFIDTNVFLDVFCDRADFIDDAKKILKLCEDGVCAGVVAAHSILNIHYIARKYLAREQRKNIVIYLCQSFKICGVDSTVLLGGALRDDFEDFEDSVQYECALASSADFIVTRNKDDFASSKIPVLSPKEFLDEISQGGA